ncbi:prolyl 4-hydroxylase subunit alpha-2-like [Dama dama]
MQGSIALSPRFKSWTISEISASGLDLYRAVNFTNQLLSLDSSHRQAQLNLPYFVKLLEEERAGNFGNEESEIKQETLNSSPQGALDYKQTLESCESLCHGEGIKLRRKRLFCRYHYGNRTPQLVIAPFKEEDEWDSPHIIRFYNVMSDEIRKIKEIAKPKMK